MLLNIEKSGEQDQERSEEWLVNTGPDQTSYFQLFCPLIYHPQSDLFTCQDLFITTNSNIISTVTITHCLKNKKFF